jgi:hypothetical protein
MPDRFGFNELGPEVRCIHCDEGGPRWQWPDDRRDQHHRDHEVSISEDDLGQIRALESDARRERRHSTNWWIKLHEPRKCANPYCSTTFVPVRITRTYCSDRCRKAATRSSGGR